jgi:hypothetical protein
MIMKWKMFCLKIIIGKNGKNNSIKKLKMIPQL